MTPSTSPSLYKNPIRFYSYTPMSIINVNRNLKTAATLIYTPQYYALLKNFLNNSDSYTQIIIRHIELLCNNDDIAKNAANDTELHQLLIGLLRATDWEVKIACLSLLSWIMEHKPIDKRLYPCITNILADGTVHEACLYCFELVIEWLNFPKEILKLNISELRDAIGNLIQRKDYESIPKLYSMAKRIYKELGIYCKAIK